MVSSISWPVLRYILNIHHVKYIHLYARCHFKFKKFYIGVLLINSVTLVLRIQPSDSVTYIHISIFKFFSCLGYYRMLSRAPVLYSRSSLVILSIAVCTCWSKLPVCTYPSWASLVGQLVKNPPAMQETQVRSLSWEDSPGGGNGHPLTVFWPGEFHGLCSPWGSKDWDKTEQLSLPFLTGN